MSVLTSPAAIAQLRRQLFELKDEIALSDNDWHTIFPFVDNMWVERNASRAKDRQQYNCRIWRNDASKKTGQGKRNRSRRNVEPCSMKMYVIKKEGGVVISRCPGRTANVETHNHDLEYLDKVKTPSAIMRFASEIMRLGKSPSEAVKELKSLALVQALENDGGLYIDANRVRNAHKASTQPPSADGTPAVQKRTNFPIGTSPGLQSVFDLRNQSSAATDSDRGLPLRVSCQCGVAHFSTPFAKPLDLYHCHCLECQKQSASAFGTSAIYPADFLFPLFPELAAKLSIYTRPTKTGGKMECYFCKTCGTRMFHRNTDARGISKPTVSIKGGVIDGLDWSNGKHIWTSRAVVPIPQNVVQWNESPEPEPIPEEAEDPNEVDDEDESMHEPSVGQAPIAPMHALEGLAAMATATAANGVRQRHEQYGQPISVDPMINPDLPAFPFP
jgi:hypothetical protein